jgi:hypothetical protein
MSFLGFDAIRSSKINIKNEFTVTELNQEVFTAEKNLLKKNNTDINANDFSHEPTLLSNEVRIKKMSQLIS